MKHASMLLFVGLALFGSVLQAQQAKTPVEHVKRRSTTAPAVLGTKDYAPSAQEKAYFDKLTEVERRPIWMPRFFEYDIRAKDGVYVGWFGIIREITEDAKSKTTELLIEHKYSNGLTDLHMQVLDFNGGGDFRTTLRGTNLGLSPLALVRIYGEASVKDGTITIPSPEFLKQWEWGSFSFITMMGKQVGSKRWRKHLKIGRDQLYSSNPDTQYYIDRLGPRPLKLLPPIVLTAEVVKPKPHDKQKFEKIDYADASGELMTNAELVAFLRNHGVRRRRRRNPSDSTRSLTQIQINATREMIAERALSTTIHGVAQDIGIQHFSCALPGGEPVQLVTRESLPAGFDADSCRRFIAKAPKAKRGLAHRRKEPELSFSTQIAQSNKSRVAVAAADVDETFKAWSESKAPLVIIQYEGGTSFGQIMDLVERAKKAGLKKVGVSPSNMLMFSSSSSSFRTRVATITVESLKPTVMGIIQAWPSHSSAETLLFFEEDTKRTGDDLDHNAVTGSLMMLAALAMNEQMDMDATEEVLLKKCLKAAIKKISSEPLPKAASLRRHAWMCFALAKIAQYADSEELELAVPIAFREIKKNRLTLGGWPARVGEAEADLETSCMMALALREANVAGVYSPGQLLSPEGVEWLAPRTDEETGFWYAGPREGFAFSSIDGEALHRMTFGHHPEMLTAYCVAYRIAHGQTPKDAIVKKQLDRILALTPPIDVASPYFDSRHALICAWLADELDDPAWREFNQVVATAMSSHIGRTDVLRADTMGGAGLKEGRFLPDARIAIALKLLLDYSPKKK